MNRVYFTHETIEYAFISPFLYRLDGQRLNKVEFKDASDSLKAAVDQALNAQVIDAAPEEPTSEAETIEFGSEYYEYMANLPVTVEE